MSDPRDGIKCGYGLYVMDVNGGNAKIRRDYPPGGVEIERADIPDVIAALQAVMGPPRWRYPAKAESTQEEIDSDPDTCSLALNMLFSTTSFLEEMGSLDDDDGKEKP